MDEEMTQGTPKENGRIGLRDVFRILQPDHVRHYHENYIAGAIAHALANGEGRAPESVRDQWFGEATEALRSEHGPSVRPEFRDRVRQLLSTERYRSEALEHVPALQLWLDDGQWDGPPRPV